MKNMTFNNAIKKAKSLKKDANTPIYQSFDGKQLSKGFTAIIYGEKYPDAATVFIAQHLYKYKQAPYNNGYLYIKSVKNSKSGEILPKGMYRDILMFHKKYARIDVEITKVDFNIVGIKRATTHLKPGVLISNIRYTIPVIKSSK